MTFLPYVLSIALGGGSELAIFATRYAPGAYPDSYGWKFFKKASALGTFKEKDAEPHGEFCARLHKG